MAEDGIWDTVVANWNDAATTGSGIVWSNVPPMRAVFGGAAGDVDVEGSVEFSSLSFVTDGYVLADADDDGTLNLSGFSTLSADSNVTVVISEQLTGTNGFVKSGAGVVVLSGTNTATLSGQVFVNEGTLRWGDFYGMPATSSDKPITVVDGATLDLGALTHFDVSRHYAIAGKGVNNAGALMKSGPNSIYGGWCTDSVKLLDACNMFVYSEIKGTGTLYINRASITPAEAANCFVDLYAKNTFTGTVSIGRGLCNLKASASLRGATRIELAAGVTLDIQNPGDTLGDEVVLVIPDDGNSATGITLTNGMAELVGRVILGGTSYGPGSGSFGSSVSVADHQDNEYFSGAGIVYVQEAEGTLIIMR